MPYLERPKIYSLPDRGAGQILALGANGNESPKQAQKPILPKDPERRSLAEKWIYLPVRTDTYSGGEYYKDGKLVGRYPEGKKLIFGTGADEQEVMNTFELPWVEATVEKLLNDNTTGPVVTVEGGRGMGLASRRILAKMISLGGEYHIFELNEQLYKDTEKWVAEKQESVDRLGLRPLKLKAHWGDANELIKTFKPKSINRALIDLHQLTEDERGMENLQMLDDLITRLTDDGKYSFCAFHKNNQTGGLDSKQIERISLRFKNVETARVEAVPPRDCPYMQWPNRFLPVVLCSNPTSEK